MKRVLVSDSMAPEVAEILGNAPGIKVDIKTVMTSALTEGKLTAPLISPVAK